MQAPRAGARVTWTPSPRRTASPMPPPVPRPPSSPRSPASPRRAVQRAWAAAKEAEEPAPAPDDASSSVGSGSVGSSSRGRFSDPSRWSGRRFRIRRRLRGDDVSRLRWLAAGVALLLAVLVACVFLVGQEAAEQAIASVYSRLMRVSGRRQTDALSDLVLTASAAARLLCEAPDDLALVAEAFPELHAVYAGSAGLLVASGTAFVAANVSTTTTGFAPINGSASGDGVMVLTAVADEGACAAEVSLEQLDDASRVMRADVGAFRFVLDEENRLVDPTRRLYNDSSLSTPMRRIAWQLRASFGPNLDIPLTKADGSAYTHLDLQVRNSLDLWQVGRGALGLERAEERIVLYVTRPDERLLALGLRWVAVVAVPKSFFTSALDEALSAFGAVTAAAFAALGVLAYRVGGSRRGSRSQRQSWFALALFGVFSCASLGLAMAWNSAIEEQVSATAYELSHEAGLAAQERVRGNVDRQEAALVLLQSLAASGTDTAAVVARLATVSEALDATLAPVEWLGAGLGVDAAVWVRRDGVLAICDNSTRAPDGARALRHFHVDTWDPAAAGDDYSEVEWEWYEPAERPWYLAAEAGAHVTPVYAYPGGAGMGLDRVSRVVVDDDYDDVIVAAGVSVGFLSDDVLVSALEFLNTGGVFVAEGPGRSNPLETLVATTGGWRDGAVVTSTGDARVSANETTVDDIRRAAVEINRRCREQRADVTTLKYPDWRERARLTMTVLAGDDMRRADVRAVHRDTGWVVVSLLQVAVWMDDIEEWRTVNVLISTALFVLASVIMWSVAASGTGGSSASASATDEPSTDWNSISRTLSHRLETVWSAGASQRFSVEERALNYLRDVRSGRRTLAESIWLEEHGHQAPVGNITYRDLDLISTSGSLRLALRASFALDLVLLFALAPGWGDAPALSRGEALALQALPLMVYAVDLVASVGALGFRRCEGLQIERGLSLLSWLHIAVVGLMLADWWWVINEPYQLDFGLDERYVANWLTASSVLRPLLPAMRVAKLREAARQLLSTLVASRRVFIVGLSFVSCALSFALVLTYNVDSADTQDLRSAFVGVFAFVFASGFSIGGITPKTAPGAGLQVFLYVTSFVGATLLISLLIGTFQTVHASVHARALAEATNHKRMAMMAAFMTLHDPFSATLHQDRRQLTAAELRTNLPWKTCRHFLLRVGATKEFWRGYKRGSGSSPYKKAMSIFEFVACLEQLDFDGVLDLSSTGMVRRPPTGGGGGGEMAPRGTTTGAESVVSGHTEESDFARRALVLTGDGTAYQRVVLAALALNVCCLGLLGTRFRDEPYVPLLGVACAVLNVADFVARVWAHGSTFFRPSLVDPFRHVSHWFDAGVALLTLASLLYAVAAARVRPLGDGGLMAHACWPTLRFFTCIECNRLVIFGLASALRVHVPLLGLLALLLLSFAVVGTLMFAGVFHFMDDYALQGDADFDDLASSVQTLYRLLLLIQWRTVMAAAMDSQISFRATFFFLFYACAVSILASKLIMSLVCGSFSSLDRFERERRTRGGMRARARLTLVVSRLLAEGGSTEDIQGGDMEAQSPWNVLEFGAEDAAPSAAELTSMHLRVNNAVHAARRVCSTLSEEDAVRVAQMVMAAVSHHEAVVVGPVAAAGNPGGGPGPGPDDNSVGAVCSVDGVALELDGPGSGPGSVSSSDDFDDFESGSESESSRSEG